MISESSVVQIEGFAGQRNQDEGQIEMRIFELRSTLDQELYQIQLSGDGTRLWVNGPDGSAVGRFSKRFGIDVHRSGTEQIGGSGACLFCTHAKAGPVDWQRFLAAVQEHYGLAIKADCIRFENDASSSVQGSTEQPEKLVGVWKGSLKTQGGRDGLHRYT